MSSLWLIVEQMGSTAEWRHRKAEEFPDDGRNLEAAAELEKLAKEIKALEGSDIDRRLEQLEALEAESDGVGFIVEWLSEELRAIGFRTAYENGAEFLKSYCDELEESLREQINNDDDDVESPDLAEQVENDPAVKAAKEAYEEARAKAYAEARKRL
jgi:hypothetical protein